MPDIYLDTSRHPHRFFGDSCSILSYPQIITLNKQKKYILTGYLTTFPKKKDFWIFLAGASRSCLTINPCSKVKVKRVKVIILKPVTIVIRGDWLWKAAKINDKNNSAAVYVQSTVKVHNPLFSVGKLLRNKLMQRFYWSIQSKW